MPLYLRNILAHPNEGAKTHAAMPPSSYDEKDGGIAANHCFDPHEESKLSRENMGNAQSRSIY